MRNPAVLVRIINSSPISHDSPTIKACRRRCDVDTTVIESSSDRTRDNRSRSGSARQIKRTVYVHDTLSFPLIREVES